MATVTLNKTGYEANDGLESIIIVRDLADVPGGRSLDVTGWADDVIKAGHVIIKTAAGEYKPLGVSEGAYAAIAEGETAVGVLKATVLKSEAFAAIMTQGQVNAAACAVPVTAAIKTALPRIEFLNA